MQYASVQRELLFYLMSMRMMITIENRRSKKLEANGNRARLNPEC